MEAVKVSKQPTISPTATAQRPGEFLAPMIPLGRWFGMSPFAMMRELSDEMDRTFRGAAPAGGTEIAAWSPTVDVRQCNGDLVVTAELPGLKKDEVKVEVAEGALVIQGERKQEHKEDHEGYHRWERSYGQFYRSIALPEGAKTDQVKAEMQDGLLKVSVPVPQTEKKSRQVPIETKMAATAKG
jgi:HSP20 family protein